MLRFATTLFWASLLFSSTEVLACDLVYEVRSGDEVSALCVTIEKNGEGITYRSTYRDVTQLYYYSTDNLLMRWEYADSGAGADFNANRNGDEIVIRGKFRGEPVNEALKAGDQIWLQNSEFGLLPFLKAKEKSKDFFVIAPEDLSLKKLRASRAAVEEITWQDKQIRAAKTTARLRGFLSLFWQATYWHRVPEMTFLRYKANGLPGIPEVDIELVREKALN